MIRKVLDDLFTKELLDAHPKEWGIANHCDNPSLLGYATTITPRTIYQAVGRGVDVIVTHHDAWEFMFEQRDQVYALLNEKGITHVWAHLPLDQADFGTSATLLSKVGCRKVRKPLEGEAIIGELAEPMNLESVCSRLNSLLKEQPHSVYNANRPIQRIGCVTEAGIYTSYLRDIIPYEIDLYVTGETSLYLLEYAQHHELSVAVYSHNYTELPGVQMLAERLCQSIGLEMMGHLGDSHF